MSVAALADAPSRAQSLRYDLVPHGLALAAFALGAFAPAVFNDGDTWTHIAAGNWIVDHHAVPRVDPFTWSFAGQPWTAHEWLAELALGLAWRLGGFVAVALLTAAAAAMAVYIVARSAARELGGPGLLVVGALALSLIAPSLLARPHILALPVFALWTRALFDASSRGRAPPLPNALLMAIWANLHGGFAFGLALIAPAAIEAALAAGREARLPVARAWAVFAAVAVVAALLTPFGVEGLLFPLRLLSLGALSRIGDWAPESFARANALEAVLIGLIALAAMRPLRLSPVRLATLVALLHLSLAHARHEMLLAVVAPMLLAGPIARALDAPAEAQRLRPSFARAALAAAALALGLARAALPAPDPGAFASTRAALAALPPEVKPGHGLNGYSFGGYLIFEGVAPYVDGRADMFGDAFLAHYAAMARGDRQALAATLADGNVGWTMFAPDQGAVAALDATPGWRRVYADARVVAHARVAPDASAR